MSSERIYGIYLARLKCIVNTDFIII